MISVVAGNVIVIQAKFHTLEGVSVFPTSADITIKNSTGVAIASGAMSRIVNEEKFEYEFSTLNVIPDDYIYTIQSLGSIQAAARGIFKIY